MFKLHGLLPNDVARQNPILLFDMLNKLDWSNDNTDDNKAIDTSNIPDHLKFFYGM